MPPIVSSFEIGRVEQTTTQEIAESSPPKTWTARGAGG
jgi:hypothetical protein